MSTVLFNVAFNTSFEHLSELEHECAYNFHAFFQTGYADDLGIVTGTRTSGCVPEQRESATMVSRMACLDKVYEGQAKEVIRNVASSMLKPLESTFALLLMTGQLL